MPSLYWQQTIALVPSDSITFEIELIRQVEINIDYILMLVMKYHESNCKDKSILGTIDRAIDSSIQLRSKKDLIHGFINTVNAATDVDRDWQSYVQQQKQQELEQIIAEEKLKPAEAQRFVANAFRDGALKTTGTDIDQILPPVSRFGGGNRTEKKKTIIQRLAQFFEKYFGIKCFHADLHSSTLWGILQIERPKEEVSICVRAIKRLRF